MGTYSIGNETKEKIIHACKQLFYENGVENTTFDNICALTGINRGLITYHFKGKSKIAAAIYAEFIEKFDKECKELLATDDANILYVATEYLLYREVKRNKNFGRFYDAIEVTGDLYESSLSLNIALIDGLLAYNHIEMSDAEIRTVSCMFQGTEREIVHNIYTDYLTESIDEIVSRDIHFVFYALGMKRDMIERICEEALALANKHELIVGENFEFELK